MQNRAAVAISVVARRAGACLLPRPHARPARMCRAPNPRSSAATSLPLAAAKTGAEPRCTARQWESGGEPISPAWSHV